VTSRLSHLDDSTDLEDGLALGDQLLRSFQLADDLLHRVPGVFMVRSPAQSGKMRTRIHPGPILGIYFRVL